LSQIKGVKYSSVCHEIRFFETLTWGTFVQSLHLPPWASAGGGQNGHFRPLKIGTKNQKFLENLKSAA